MKTKIFAVTIAVLLYSVAAAQGYTIRILNNANLRAVPGLNGRILETAPAGTTLHIVGEFNKWLKVNRKGKDAWIAGWVSHARLDNGSSISSQVDNCCFVDRQCNTDQDWTAGYWAFQQNQCPRPAESQTQTSAPPASNSSAQIDNCCFLDWQCNTTPEWLAGYHAYQNNQCDNPGILQLGVGIEGPAAFVTQVSEALSLLKYGAPQWFAYAIAGLDKIKDVPDSHGASLLGRTVHLGSGHVNYSAYWLASVIVHEACHTHQRNAGSQYGTLQERLAEEAKCAQVQLQALEVIEPHSPFKPHLQSMIANPGNYWN